MADLFDEEKRSYVMSRVRSRDTKPELIVRSLLHRAGFRYSLKRTDLPGKPDIVMPKYQTVIFVHGCFWHRHPSCKRTTMPATRVEFWQTKFERTIARDAANVCELRKFGWQVIIVWECQVMADPIATVSRVIEQLGADRTRNLSGNRRQVMRDANARFDAVWRQRDRE